MLDDILADPLHVALVAAVGLGALLIYTLVRILASGKAHEKQMPSKIEPRLFPDDHRHEAAHRREPAAEGRGRFGVGVLSMTFIAGLCIGVLASPWARQSLAPLPREFADRVEQTVRAAAPSDSGRPNSRDEGSFERPNTRHVASGQVSANKSDDLVEDKLHGLVNFSKNKIPFAVDNGVDLVDIFANNDLLELRFRLSRLLSDQEKRVFSLTLTDQTQHIVCEIPANAEIRAFMDRSAEVNVTYLDYLGRQIAKGSVPVPICDDPGGG